MNALARALFQPTEAELRARADADTEIVARDDLLLSARPPLEYPWSSQVCWVRWDAARIDAGIDEVLGSFRARRQAFVWLVTEGSTPESLRDRLEERGFIRELEGRMLLARLPLPTFHVNADVRVEEVTDRARMEDAIRVDHPNGRPAHIALLLKDRMRRLGKDWHAAVAYIRDKPVGTARWMIHRALRAVEFTGAETLSQYRRQGVYSTLVAYRAAYGAREDCAFAGIIADSGTSAPILMKRGFEDHGRATYFLWPVSHFTRAAASLAQRTDAP
ncbi:MAG: hypothetical protein ACRDGT_01990 [Candidatus Limnocylindria bacterium]